jgi:large subunit ribosomal protein L31
MKKEIHPEVHSLEARCVCGKTYQTLSTEPEIVVTFCAACHPFFTGNQQFADVEGRIDKYYKKYGKKPNA